MNEVSLITLNMHCGMEEDYVYKMQSIIQAIGESGVDFVGLQECVQHKDKAVVASNYGVAIKEGNLAEKIFSLFISSHSQPLKIHFRFMCFFGSHFIDLCSNFVGRQ